jgi:hypothetical protein
MSAIPAVANFIGMAFVGSALFGGYRFTTMRYFGFAVVSYLAGLAGAYLCAVIVQWLAPKFGSSGSRVDALKVVAYASTATWVAGVFSIFPAVGPLVSLIGALYGIYLFYLGLPAVMRTPKDQVVVYMIVCAVAVFVVSVVLGMIVGGVVLSSVS